MHTYTDKDCDLAPLHRKNIAIIGYGSQGHAHALNLRDSGLPHVKVGLREGSGSLAKAAAQGLQTDSIEACAKWADIIMLLVPDETQETLYHRAIAPHLKPGASLAFAHGFCIHFGRITPREDLDVWMIAPKEIGPVVRSEYEQGRGVPSLLAIHQNATGDAKTLALAYASAIGAGRTGILETSFKEECEVDLFGEQAVLFGAIPPILRLGYDTLTQAGYSPQMAYFKCVQQLKLVADAIYHHGIAQMSNRISNTAEYGGYIAEETLVTAQTKQAMQDILRNIQTGQFSRDFLHDRAANGPNQLEALRHEKARHPMEETGRTIRKLLGLAKH